MPMIVLMGAMLNRCLVAFGDIGSLHRAWRFGSRRFAAPFKLGEVSSDVLDDVVTLCDVSFAVWVIE